MEPTCWGCAPPMYPQFPIWGINPWAPYPTGPVYFHPRLVPPRHMFRPNMHEKKAWFGEAARAHDTIVVQRKRSSVHSADGEVHIGGQKFSGCRSIVKVMQKHMMKLSVAATRVVQ